MFVLLVVIPSHPETSPCLLAGNAAARWAPKGNHLPQMSPSSNTFTLAGVCCFSKSSKETPPANKWRLCFLVRLNGIFHSGRISQSPRMPLLGFRSYNFTLPCCSLLAANHQIMQNDIDEAKPGNQSFFSPPWSRQCSPGGQPGAHPASVTASLPLW